MVNEIREDIFGREVIIATKRSKRPGASISKGERRKHECPFCKGNEKLTPPSILVYPNEKNWKIRMFRNKFPVLYQKKFEQLTGGFYKKFTSFGLHQVLVETPNHNEDYEQMKVDQISLIFKTLKKHYEKLMKRNDVKYVAIFKNKGEGGGESIYHTHLQIVASSLFPEVIAKEMEDSERYFKREGRCGHCSMIKKEIESRKRVVDSNRNWICFAPYVSVWPFQLSFLPKRHFSDISEMKGEEITDLATIYHRVFKGIKKIYPKISYNMVYNNFPRSDFSHFRIDFYPRLVMHAGLEFFGINVNVVSPEDAAKQLRGKIINKD
jgi:UDPglucose--hexose-1-phosphate uridylyltransferase